MEDAWSGTRIHPPAVRSRKRGAVSWLANLKTFLYRYGGDTARFRGEEARLLLSILKTSLAKNSCIPQSGAAKARQPGRGAPPHLPCCQEHSRRVRPSPRREFDGPDGDVHRLRWRSGQRW